MNKNYIENSLKRFLKRKVKITLGLVVSFMITGMVSFGADKPLEEMDDFEKAEYYLKELGEKKLDIAEGEYSNSKGNQKITVSEENGNIKLKFEGFEDKGPENPSEIIIDNKYISNITKPIIEKSFQNIITALENGEIIVNTELGGKTNNGIINGGNSQGIGIIDGGTNNGLILSQYGIRNDVGINNGVIIFSSNGMYGGNVTNNGLLFGTYYNEKSQKYIITGNGQFVNPEKTAINNGVIISEYGQYTVTANEGKAINYGIINATGSGQHVQGSVKFTMNNYGKVEAATGQKIVNHNAIKDIAKENTVNNYGAIDATIGQHIGDTNGYTQGNTANNYGVIKINENGTAIKVANDDKVTDEKLKNKGFNYGAVIVDTATNQQTPVKVFEGDVTNKGIVILDKYTGTDLTNVALGDKNNGLVFSRDNNGDYSWIKTDNAVEITDKNISNDNLNGKTTVYVTETGNKIENLKDKVVGTIVKDDISNTGAVITADKDLVLENTVITGYFENNGTLLDMGSHNLSLLGDTKLAASKDNFDLTNVNALNIDGTLKLLGNAEIAGKITGNGTMVEVAVKDNRTSAVELKEVVLENAIGDEIKYLGEKDDALEEKEKLNYTEVSYNGGLKTDKVTLKFKKTAEGKENTVTFTDNLLIEGKDGIAIDGTGTLAGSNININFSSLDSDKVKGDIKLGGSDDDIVISKNGLYKGTVDMGAGNDTFTVEGFAQNTTRAEDNHKELGTFNYKLAGVETVTLKGDGIKGNNGWHIGEGAEIISKGENGTKLIIENEQLHVDMNNNFGMGNVTTSLDKLAGENGANGLVLETSKDEKTGEDTGLVKFTVGENFNVSDKKFNVAADYDLSKANLGAAVIFKGTGEEGTIEQNKNGEVELTVKEASELGLSGYEGIYNAVLKGLSQDGKLRDAVNYQNETALQGMIKGAGNTAEAFYTTGYAVTKDVADTYMSVVEDFGRKAGAGEWIAYGKYVNSDTEFDGGSKSKGYDGDITGTVGMIEYGVNDTTSYGVVYGQGDTEVDIQGGGKLDGDNSYFGGYVKHRTQNGIDVLGNVGITKSELDLSFASDVKVNDETHHIITDGKSDADALTLSVKVRKDYKLTDTVKLQPVVGARYSFISQDEVTSSDANFKMEEQDVTIFEGSFGGNLVKEFDIYNGKLSLSAGAEYVMTDVNKDENARYTLYNEELHFTGEEEIADSRVEGHVGIDYEHENGIGVDAKYEMIWTDKGDNERFTAGVSYRF